MKQHFILFVFTGLQCILSSQSILISEVNVVDVASGVINEAQDVLVQDGMITAISSEIKNTDADTVIDGTGLYLSPGMVDAHIHLFQSGGLYTRPDAIDLTVIKSYDSERQWLIDHAAEIMKSYLSVGVTSVVDVGGPMYQYDERDKFSQIGGLPDLYMTGPLISTYLPPELDIDNPPIIKVTTSEQARELVRKQVPLKPDFIKIWYIAIPTKSVESTYDIVKATIDEASLHDLPVAVHATQLNTAKLAIKAGASILVHSIGDPVDDDFIKLLTDNNVVYIPTLTVHGNYNLAFAGKIDFQPEDFDIVSPQVIDDLLDIHHVNDPYLDQVKKYAGQYLKSDYFRDSIRKFNLSILMNTDAIIATGTDAGNIGTLHASSYIEEVEAMRKAGMKDADILKASTMNGAIVSGNQSTVGQIQEGMKADMLLLDGNPLDDIQIATHPRIVIKNGVIVDHTTNYTSPEELAQQQLNGYNVGDIEAFLKPYADDVEVYTFPDQLMYKGKDKMRESYAYFFASTPQLHCELKNRMINGNTVIDEELVTGLSNGQEIEAIAIYKIENEKIAKVYFVR